MKYNAVSVMCERELGRKMDNGVGRIFSAQLSHSVSTPQSHSGSSGTWTWKPVLSKQRYKSLHCHGTSHIPNSLAKRCTHLII